MPRKRWYVTLQEVWERLVVVEAETEDEAKELAVNGNWKEEEEFSFGHNLEVLAEAEEEETP